MLNVSDCDQSRSVVNPVDDTVLAYSYPVKLRWTLEFYDT